MTVMVLGIPSQPASQAAAGWAAKRRCYRASAHDTLGRDAGLSGLGSMVALSAPRIGPDLELLPGKPVEHWTRQFVIPWSGPKSPSSQVESPVGNQRSLSGGSAS